MSRIHRFFRRLRLAALLALLLAAIVAAVWFTTGGVSNRAVQNTVTTESAAIQAKVDARANELVGRLESVKRKLEATDRKLDSIDAKLDRLIEFMLRPLPDGLEKAE